MELNWGLVMIIAYVVGILIILWMVAPYVLDILKMF